MSASNTDKITDVRNAARPNSARVTSGRSAGGATLACDNLSGWPTASKVHFVTYKIDSNSDVVAGSQLDCYGIVSGNNIGSFTVVDGTDTGHAVGDVVEMLPTAAWGQDLADALGLGHERTGAHKANLPLTTPILTAPAIADFTSAPHTHSSTAQGGKLNGTNAITTNTLFSTVLGLSNALDPTNGVQSQTNAGTAGGTMYYINLGGIKLCWGLTATQAQGSSYTITLPTSFFSTIQSIVVNAFVQTVTANQFISVNAASNSSITLNFVSTTGTGTTQSYFLVIGT